MTTAVAKTNYEIALAGPVGSLDSYIHAVGVIPVLSKEDEQNLARQLRDHEDLDAARDAVHEAVVSLDKAAQKGVLHHRNSARHKSRLQIKLNAAVAVRQVSGETTEAEAEAPAKRASASKRTSKK